MNIKRKPPKAGGRWVGHVEVGGGVTTEIRGATSPVPILENLSQTLMKFKTNFRRWELIVTSFSHREESSFKYVLTAVLLPTWSLGQDFCARVL